MFPINVLRMRSPEAAAPAFDKLVSTTVFPAVDHFPGTTSYTALRDGGGGGTPIAVTITKSAGTSILIMGSASIRNGIPSLGVNDGTTNYDLAESRTEATAAMRTLAGSRLITGLASNTYTFTLMLKSPGSDAGLIGDKSSASLTAMEVA